MWTEHLPSTSLQVHNPHCFARFRVPHTLCALTGFGTQRRDAAWNWISYESEFRVEKEESFFFSEFAKTWCLWWLARVHNIQTFGHTAADTMRCRPNANACGCKGDALFTKSDEAQLKGGCFNKSIGLFHKYYETCFDPRIPIETTVGVFGWGTHVEMCKPTPFQSHICSL